MFGVVNLLRGLLQQTKKIDKYKLPSQGVFYKKDFEIKIKKADLEDIIEYELNFDKDNLYSVVELIKKIVRKNVIISDGYKFEDVKSLDIVFLFLEVVKFTMNKEIIIKSENKEMGIQEKIIFDHNNFNYFDFTPYEINEDEGVIMIEGYKFSMPSIGVENSLTNFLMSKTDENSKKWSEYNYDFIFFCGDKNNLTFSEIENLITIFNYDIESTEQSKIKKIVKIFMKLVGYTLISNGKVIDVKSKLDLQTIWKD